MFYRRRLRSFLLTTFILSTPLFYFLETFRNPIHETTVFVEIDDIIFGEHRCSRERIPINDVVRFHRQKKLILFYTTIFGRVPLFHISSFKCCQPFRCEITVDKSRLLESDAVIFHGRDLPAAHLMPKRRNTKQRWIFYTLENPYNSKIVPKDYNGMFNWTMTYERRSDIYEPYGFYTKKPNLKGFEPRNYATGKDKLAAFVNSHCRTIDTLRENYVRALSRHVKVNVFGECGGVFGRIMCPRNSKRCERILRRYKFYLAFENGRCQDYISEKYWDIPLKFGLVPVVYGGKSFEDLAIPGSYIDASKFKTAESLAKYLKYLDSNDTAYNQYFTWKKFFRRENIEPWPCRLCEMLHNSSLPEHTYKHFDKFLDPNAVCEKNSDPFQSYSYP